MGDNLQLIDTPGAAIDPRRPALLTFPSGQEPGERAIAALREVYAGDHPVTLLTKDGPLQATVATINSSQTVDAIYLPAAEATENLRTLEGLAAIVARLNAPGGCPWDGEQTHETLRSYLVEETYEALQAINEGDRAALVEELGDVLLQVFMHAEVARREGTFTIGDITESIGSKLIRRHPHVFGEVDATSADEVARNWEQIKKSEKPGGSILDGVPAALPALAASQSLQGRARRVGFDWPDIEGPLAKLQEELGEFARADNTGDREEEFGDILFVIANIADHLGIDAEQALRLANGKFRSRFGIVEHLAAERGLEMREMDLPALDALWEEAKARLAGANDV